MYEKKRLALCKSQSKELRQVFGERFGSGVASTFLLEERDVGDFGLPGDTADGVTEAVIIVSKLGAIDLLEVA